MQRFGQVIGIKPDQIAAYETLHRAVWPEVCAIMSAHQMRNYSIFRHAWWMTLQPLFHLD